MMNPCQPCANNPVKTCQWFSIEPKSECSFFGVVVVVTMHSDCDVVARIEACTLYFGHRDYMRFRCACTNFRLMCIDLYPKVSTSDLHPTSRVISSATPHVMHPQRLRLEEKCIRNSTDHVVDFQEQNFCPRSITTRHVLYHHIGT